LSTIWDALTRNGARTDRQSPDAALRGRTYAISFDRVWNAALEVCSGAARGWVVTTADDQVGLIQAVTPKRLLGAVADVTVRVTLDENGQTRVDVEAMSRDSTRDLGANRKRIRRFLPALDRKLGATHAQILEDSPPVEATS
jgi:uncharacterized protein (DUF1499 family)